MTNSHRDMSFHKRIYNWERIKNYAQNADFDTFDRFIFGPEAHILQDDESSHFFKCYCGLPGSHRSIILDCLKEEDDKFIMDLIKCTSVVNNENNSEDHYKSVDNYRDLFIKKWGVLAEKYIKLIK